MLSVRFLDAFGGVAEGSTVAVAVTVGDQRYRTTAERVASGRVLFPAPLLIETRGGRAEVSLESLSAGASTVLGRGSLTLPAPGASAAGEATLSPSRTVLRWRAAPAADTAPALAPPALGSFSGGRTVAQVGARHTAKLVDVGTQTTEARGSAFADSGGPAGWDLPDDLGADAVRAREAEQQRAHIEAARLRMRQHNDDRSRASVIDARSPVAADLNAMKRLMAAWPVDEIEGLMAYCDALRAERSSAERRLAGLACTQGRSAARALSAGSGAPVPAPLPSWDHRSVADQAHLSRHFASL